MHRPFDAARRRLFGAVALASGLSFASMVAAAPYNPDQLTAPQITRIDQACQGGIGLEAGETPYAACIASLSDSVRSADESRSIVEARRACRGEGFGRDTAGLADCTLRSVDEAGPAGVIPAAAPAAQAAGSYFYASRGETYQRERAACASLGLDPAGGAFTSCVSNLQSALLAADNPF